MSPSDLRLHRGALDLAGRARPARQVDAGDAVHREQRQRLLERSVDPRLPYVARVQYPLDRHVVDVQPREPLEHPRRRLVGVDGDPRHDRDGQAGRAGVGDERGHPLGRADVVEQREVGTGPLLLDQPAGPHRGRDRLARLRHPHRVPSLDRERSQRGAVEVEDLRHSWPHPRRPAVTGHAEHPVGPGEGQSGQLLLEDQPVAVAARERHPWHSPGLADQLRHHRGREVGAFLVLADQQGVARARQAAGQRRHRARVVRRHGQVGDHRTSRGQRGEQAGRRRRRCRRTGPAHRVNPPDEGARLGRHLARPVVAHAPARPVSHVLGADPDPCAGHGRDGGAALVVAARCPR